MKCLLFTNNSNVITINNFAGTYAAKLRDKLRPLLRGHDGCASDSSPGGRRDLRDQEDHPHAPARRGPGELWSLPLAGRPPRLEARTRGVWSTTRFHPRAHRRPQSRILRVSFFFLDISYFDQFRSVSFYEK